MKRISLISFSVAAVVVGLVAAFWQSTPKAAVSAKIGSRFADVPRSAYDTKTTATYGKLSKYLDAVPAIDTHDHLRDLKRGGVHELWRRSYYTWTGKLTPQGADQPFDNWWRVARHDFDDSRATSFYRYQLPAFRDLYGVDFDRMTPGEARRLDEQIRDNYNDPRWIEHVVTERANIELMFIDPFWARYEYDPPFKFAVPVFNVTPLVRGFHADEFPSPADSPYVFAKKEGLEVHSLDDYLTVLDRMFQTALAQGAICLKTTLAYDRTLRFENVPKAEAEAVFGKPRGQLSDAQIKAFEDFIFWRLCELSAKHDLPFQIHTGQARIQGSNPMLLVDLIAANPDTKFILFHGGFPWIGETGVIVMRHGSHTWIDSCWLPTLSYTMAKRAYHEWLEIVPSDRIMWGADCVHAEGVYAATRFTRQCLAEVLAEKVDRGEIGEDRARRIGKQILRDNALKLFPRLKERLWKTKAKPNAPSTKTAQ